MFMAALYIPSWVFMVLLVLFLIGAFSDSIFGLGMVVCIAVVVMTGFMAQAAGEGFHDTLGWPTAHLMEADNFLDWALGEQEQEEPFYESEQEEWESLYGPEEEWEEEPEIEYR
jgi:hypothetical protein